MRFLRNVILKWLARRVIQKYHPTIIGITGSVGKTSTKEAVTAVLRTKYRVFSSVKNLNSEAGFPLSVFALPLWPKRKLDWIIAAWHGCRLLLIRNQTYPEILVLEYGADKPGDIAYLVGIAQPDIAVVTGITPVHLEFYGSFAALEKEKKTLLSAVADPQKRFVNADLVPEPYTARTYGIEQGEYRGEDSVASLSERGDMELRFWVQTPAHERMQCTVINVLGAGHVSACVAGIAIGEHFGISLAAAASSFPSYQSQPGRMRFLRGVKHSYLIDDTYNSSPQAAHMAVETLSGIRGVHRKWVVFGDMLELGSASESLHREVGVHICDHAIDFLVTVGALAHHIADGARAAGMDPSHVFEFGEREGAENFIKHRIESGDLILVKGSQGARMEKVVKEIMAEPERAGELLVERNPNI